MSGYNTPNSNTVSKKWHNEVIKEVINQDQIHYNHFFYTL